MPADLPPDLAPPSQSLDLSLRHLPPALREAGERVLARFDLGANTDTWPERFTPLTLRYPALQAEGFSIPDEVIGEAASAHAMLLIHTFLEDRLLDGQMAFTRAEALFVKQMLLDGTATLEAIAEGFGTNAAREFRSARAALHGAYAWAQTTTYVAEDNPPTSRRVIRIAAGRAAMGYMAVDALLSIVAPATRRRARNAYDWLVTGLQWVDDLQDWREDLRTGDENLLLVALAQRGLNPYTHPDNTLREANVGHALIDKGIIDGAMRAARKHFEATLRRQEALGCAELATLIQARITHLPGVHRKVHDDIETEVLACLAAQTIHRATTQD